ncbi:hypothetical protein [Streptomyces misionensis]|uniref:hypothetical protein n=1 Tax=Streptomyces misionensis TaxID=67331 RepID=UPI003401310E
MPEPRHAVNAYTGHHCGHGGHSGGGGGCGSSHQDHDATHSDYDDEEDFGDDGSDSGTGDDATPTPDASTNAVLGYGTVELVGCATVKRPTGRTPSRRG